ncbi:hypothetical protein OG709_00265 [Streptomyces sp. NBC_01267]|uniref:hypothetical protein n=1 Tax=Streptomyces sp. NBC_01267 TaxID=2903805 RepID=UPI002E35C531|nr:hypothetical protein [Streptomyces sp. NBC_01267]
MKIEAARPTIREHDDLVRARLWNFGLAEGRQAAALARNLAPWLGNVWRAGGRDAPSYMGIVNRDANPAMRAAYAWVQNAKRLEAVYKLRYLSYSAPTVLTDESVNAVFRGTDLWYHRDATNHAVQRMYDQLNGLGEAYRARHPDMLLDVPEETHPPRRARLAQGEIGRLLVGDINTQLEGCRSLVESLSAGTSTWSAARAWSNSVSFFLTQCLGRAVADGFDRLTQGLNACDYPLIAQPESLAQAYLCLGSSYLEEVVTLMPDYAGASEQAVPQPHVSMSFSGGTFYGGQFAAQIANINSSISGLSRQGGTEVADALKALEQAVLSQADLDEEQRRDLLDNVGYLGDVAQLPPEQRNRGIIRSVLAALSLAASSGNDLRQAMEAWGGVLRNLLP